MAERKSLILDKIHSDNCFSDITLEEHYDLVNSQKLLHSELIDAETKGSLKKYMKLSNGGKIKVDYKFKEIGRLNIKVTSLKEKESATCSPFMPCVVKSAICKKYYDDLDMVNCHPQIIYQVFKELKYKTDYLKKYNTNRDTMMCEMMRHDLSRKSVKALINKLCYGGSVSSWCKSNNVDQSVVHQDLIGLEAEMKSNTDKFLKRSDTIKYYSHAVEVKGSGYWNLKGTALAFCIQSIECRSILSCYKQLIRDGYIVGALIHDGLHISKGKNDDNNYDKISEQLKRLLHAKYSLSINFSIKPFHVPDELGDMIIVDNDKEGADYVNDKIKNDYIICDERIFIRIDNLWTENKHSILRQLISIVGNMNIFVEKNDDIICISKTASGCKNILHFVNPTHDNQFIVKLWESNRFKLCYQNGYWDFKKKKLMPYDDSTLTTIMIKRPYVESKEEHRKEVWDRIINPIFNHNYQMAQSYLNFNARGLAGDIEDKRWAVCEGERNCGKGVIVGLLENSFENYVGTTNSENFLFKAGQSDSAKSLSWLVPFEFKRLCITNECSKDTEGKIRINGNILKKLTSGGDRIEARQNYKDEINFKIQARPIIFCNDLPPISPADAKELVYLYSYPSKFVDKDDKRIGNNTQREMVEIVINEEGEEEAVPVKDKDGNAVFTNICSYYPMDDTIKDFCRRPEIMNAFTDILFSFYGDLLPIPECMKLNQEEFKDEASEDIAFKESFEFTKDPEDYISVKKMEYIIKKLKINASPQKYSKWLLSEGCYKIRRYDSENERIRCWVGLKLPEKIKNELDDDCFLD